MKQFLFLLLFSPLVSYAQTDAEYDTKMGLFVNAYNKQQTDKICDMFRKTKIGEYDCFWKWAQSRNDRYAEYGKIKTFAYAGIDITDPERVRVFKVVFEKKGTKAMSFTLDKKRRFGTFRFDTSSEDIDKMIEKVQ
jgi:hypothetical protein